MASPWAYSWGTAVLDAEPRHCRICGGAKPRARNVPSDADFPRVPTPPSFNFFHWRGLRSKRTEFAISRLSWPTHWLWASTIFA